MEPSKPKYLDQISLRRVFHHAGMGFMSIFTRHTGMDISCNGVYYAFFSFAMDDLLENSHISAWIGGGQRSVYWGGLRRWR
jgi:hypothetical protein